MTYLQRQVERVRRERPDLAAQGIACAKHITPLAKKIMELCNESELTVAEVRSLLVGLPVFATVELNNISFYDDTIDGMLAMRKHVEVMLKEQGE